MALKILSLEEKIKENEQKLNRLSELEEKNSELEEQLGKRQGFFACCSRSPVKEQNDQANVNHSSDANRISDLLNSIKIKDEVSMEKVKQLSIAEQKVKQFSREKSEMALKISGQEKTIREMEKQVKNITATKESLL